MYDEKIPAAYCMNSKWLVHGLLGKLTNLIKNKKIVREIKITNFDEF